MRIGDKVRAHHVLSRKYELDLRFHRFEFVTHFDRFLSRSTVPWNVPGVRECQGATKNDPLGALKIDPLFRVLLDFGLSDEPRFDLFSEPIRVALDIDRGRMMQDPVQDGRRDHRITEDLVPLGEAAVGGQDQGALLVAAGDELEEEMRPVPVRILFLFPCRRTWYRADYSNFYIYII